MRITPTSHETYKQLFLEVSNIAIFATDENRIVCEWNKSCEGLYGYSQEEAIGQKLETLIIPEYLKETFVKEFKEAQKAVEKTSAIEVEYKRKDGAIILVNANTLFINEAGETRFYAFTIDAASTHSKVLVQDLIDHKMASEEKLILISFDKANKITSFNAFAQELTGYREEEVLGRDFVTVFIPENYQAKVRQNIQGYADERRAQLIMDFPITCKNGEKTIIKWEKSIKQKIEDAGNIMLVGVDSGGQEKLEYLVNYDALTDLPNKHLLFKKMQASMNRAVRCNENMVTLFLNINNFSAINQTFGYGFGDKLLQSLSERMCSTLREYDTVARFSGDEFVLVFDNILDDLAAASVAQRVAKIFDVPFKLEGHELYLRADMGLSFFPSHANDVKMLIKYANIAMLQSRENIAVNFQIFRQEMHEKITNKSMLETSLKQAIQNKEFFVEYQPQVDTKTQKIVAAEALVRWNHPKLKTIPPLDFIPIAEDTGMIVEIGQIVLKEAVMQAKKWHDAGYTDMKISVNLSSIQLLQSNLTDMVEEILSESGLDPQYLELELTESALMENIELSLTVLGHFKKMGIKLAIDDFGTGYSSFSALSKLKADCLKIDQSFVRNISHSKEDKIIISAINAMAHRLGLQTVAEGVESESEYLFLQEEGCDVIQGYYFSKPVSAEKMESLLVHGIYHDKDTQEHFDYEKEAELKKSMRPARTLLKM